MRKHYSASQINMFLRCSAQWAFRYKHDMVSAPSSAMALGTSFHSGIEHNYKQKIKSHIDLPFDEVADAFDTKFNETMEEVDEKDLDLGFLKDQGVGILKAFHEDIFPKTQPAEVEKRIEIEFQNVDYTLVGYVDAVTTDGVIIENKSTGKKPYKISEDYMLQGAIYSIAEGLNEVRWDFGIKTKVPKSMSLQHKFNDVERDFVYKIVGNVHAAIQSESFIPNRSSFLCSRKFCGYWAICEEVHGGRVKD